eukprot:4124596-Prymnesium_polylepis.1
MYIFGSQTSLPCSGASTPLPTECAGGDGDVPRAAGGAALLLRFGAEVAEIEKGLDDFYLVVL